MLLAIGALGQLELQACALDRWVVHRMVSPSRSARSSSSFVQYTVLSSERDIPASLKMQSVGEAKMCSTSLQGRPSTRTFGE